MIAIMISCVKITEYIDIAEVIAYDRPYGDSHQDKKTWGVFMSYMVIKRNSIHVLILIDGVILRIAGHYNHSSSAHRRG